MDLIRIPFYLLVLHNIMASFHMVNMLAFSALTLLVGHQEEHPACKKVSSGFLSGVRQQMVCISSS